MATMQSRITALTAIAIAFVVSTPSWAADGSALYKTKCANCHGPNGDGKPAMKSPALRGNPMSADQMQQLLTQGVTGKKAPHAKAISGLNGDDAQAIVAFVKTLH